MTQADMIARLIELAELHPIKSRTASLAGSSDDAASSGSKSLTSSRPSSSDNLSQNNAAARAEESHDIPSECSAARSGVGIASVQSRDWDDALPIAPPPSMKEKHGGADSEKESSVSSAAEKVLKESSFQDYGPVPIEPSGMHV
jgi:hypothetical protein